MDFSFTIPKVTIEQKMLDIAHLPPSVQEVCKMCFCEVFKTTSKSCTAVHIA